MRGAEPIIIANILVPATFMIGVGLLLAAFLSPLLERLGLSKDAAWLAPLIGQIRIRVTGTGRSNCPF